MKKTLLTCIVVLLAGCATTQPDVALPTSDKTTVNLDARLIQDCAAVPHVADGSEESVQAEYAALLSLYATCARYKHDENIELKKAFNIK